MNGAQVNPPFDKLSVRSCFTHINEILVHAAEISPYDPLSFVIFVPKLDVRIYTCLPLQLWLPHFTTPLPRLNGSLLWQNWEVLEEVPSLACQLRQTMVMTKGKHYYKQGYQGRTSY